MLKDLIKQYLSEAWISFKEDEPEDSSTNNDANNNNTDTQKNKEQNFEEPETIEQPKLDWHLVRQSFIMYEGKVENPNEMFWIFSDQVVHGSNKDPKENNKKDKNNNNKDKLFKNNLKNDLKKFATSIAFSGLTTAAIDATTNLYTSDTKRDTNKKGEKDKLAERFKYITAFNLDNLDNLKKFALTRGVPEELIIEYIDLIKEKQAEKNKEDQEGKNNKEDQKNKDKEKDVNKNKK